MVRMLRVTSAERWGTAFWGIGRRERKHKRNGDRELTAHSRTFAMKRDRERATTRFLIIYRKKLNFRDFI